MSTPTFTPGTIVYARSGEKARYVTYAPGDGHIVKEYVSAMAGDGEDYGDYDRITTWHECFLKPPVVELHEEVAQLNAKVEELRAEQFRLRRENGTIEQEIAARKERLKTHEALKNLDHFITKGLTHYVHCDDSYYSKGNITIEEFGKSENDDGYYRKYRLLCLFGDRDHNLVWNLNTYSDGSGSNSKVHPCISREEAMEVAGRLITEGFDKWRKDPKSGYSVTALIESATRLGFAVPLDAWESVKKEKLATAQKVVADAEAQLVKAREKLAKESAL